MENNFENKKYLKTLVGDNVYLSPISLDDVEKYAEMVNDIKVSVGLGYLSYTNIIDFESEKEFLISVKKEKMFAVRLLENDDLLGNIGFNSVDLLNRTATIGIMLGNPNYQRKGYGQAFIDFIIEKYKGEYSVLQVGTGESQTTIPFYEKCGFIRSHIIKNFFIDNYEHPIYEEGVQLVDRIYLKMDL